MQTLEGIEVKRVKRLAVFGKLHNKSQCKKFVKALLDDLAGLRTEIETKKAKH